MPNGSSPAKPAGVKRKTVGDMIVEKEGRAPSSVPVSTSSVAVSTSRTAVSKAGASPPRRATAAEDPYAASLDVSTLAGVLLEDDAYTALLGRPNTDIRDFYIPLMKDEYEEKQKELKDDVPEACKQQ